MPSPRHPALFAIAALALTVVASAPRRADAADGPDAVLARLAAETTGAGRLAAAKDLEAAAAVDWKPIETFLARERTSTVEQRRDVLKAIKASVPNEKGAFETPARMKAEQIRAEDDFDWLAELAPLDAAANPGLADVIADVAAVRALATLKDPKAAKVIIDLAFAKATMVYRDECGRYLRRMSPYSLPALIVASLVPKDGGLKRYAGYQLERLDRQEPSKALSAGAVDEALQIAILDAFAESGYREAVHVVFGVIDAQAPRIRETARKVVIDYVTGPPPDPAPRKPMLLPGGKRTKPQPMWLTYRELAEEELENLHERLFSQGRPEDESLEATANKIFAALDTQRADRDGAAIAAAQALATGGDFAGAAAAFDRVLAVDPHHPRAAEMVSTYLTLAKQLEGEQKWAEASAAYAKAHGIAPEGPDAEAALAAHHFTLGKSLQAEGKDGSADMRRAVEIKPDYEAAKEAMSGSGGGNRWMIYGSAGLCAAALLFLLVGLVKRSSHARAR